MLKIIDPKEKFRISIEDAIILRDNLIKILQVAKIDARFDSIEINIYKDGGILAGLSNAEIRKLD